jgi:ribonuclease P protein component
MRKKPLRALSGRRDFELVFEEGISSASQHLVIYARLNDLGVDRLGLSVSKKIGAAVIRNRIRRLLREAVRKFFGEMLMNYDLVIVAKRSSKEGTLDDFTQAIKRFLFKLNREYAVTSQREKK